MPSQSSYKPPMEQVNLCDPVASHTNTSATQETYLRSFPLFHPPPTAYIPRPSPRLLANHSCSPQGHFETRSLVSSDAGTVSTTFSTQKDPQNIASAQPFPLLSNVERGPMEDGLNGAGGIRTSPWVSGHRPSRPIDQGWRVEDSSTIYRYIEDQDTDTDDHVIRVLVSRSSPTFISRTILT